MMRRIVKPLVGALTALLPLSAFAAVPTAGFGDIGKTVGVFLGFINTYLIPAVFALALFMFLWGIFRFFFASGASDEGRTNGKQLMLWGIIAFVIMVSVWGLVNVIAGGLGFNTGTAPTLPTVPTGGGTGGGGGGGGGE